MSKSAEEIVREFECSVFDSDISNDVREDRRAALVALIEAGEGCRDVAYASYASYEVDRYDAARRVAEGEPPAPADEDWRDGGIGR